MKNVLFITLPFKSHYFPAFNLAHDYKSHGYNIHFTGLSNSESIITNQGFHFIPINYIIQNERVKFSYLDICLFNIYILK